jgi:peptide-methionine (R)-S-oxide reductase
MAKVRHRIALCAVGCSVLGAVWSGAGCGNGSLGRAGGIGGESAGQRRTNVTTVMKDQVKRTDAEWKQILTPEQYRVLREKGTERAFTGAYWNSHEPGVYRCAGCGEVLFEAQTKFDSGCGWPSFYAPAATNKVDTQVDQSLFQERTEVLCSRCGGHLGHVFDDGPKPTGLRYCINSAALTFDRASAPAGTVPRPEGKGPPGGSTP